MKQEDFKFEARLFRPSWFMSYKGDLTHTEGTEWEGKGAEVGEGRRGEGKKRE
jgi:hypothetical protein